jgi:subtilisin family serine protease
VSTVVKDSKKVQVAKQEFDGLIEKLEKDKGILYVVAAGNDGEFISELDKKGITQPPNFTESVLFNPNALVVAASTGGDSIAPFSTPAASVDMAIDGTGITVPKDSDGKADGTSLAAPQVAALVTELRALGLTTPQVRTVLADPRIYKDTKASAAQEGAGIIKPDEAKKVAKELLEKQKQAQSAPQAVSVLSLPRMLRP